MSCCGPFNQQCVWASWCFLVQLLWMRSKFKHCRTRLCPQGLSGQRACPHGGPDTAPMTVGAVGELGGDPWRRWQLSQPTLLATVTYLVPSFVVCCCCFGFGFGCAVWLARGSLFPDQESNLCPLQWECVES